MLWHYCLVHSLIIFLIYFTPNNANSCDCLNNGYNKIQCSLININGVPNVKCSLYIVSEGTVSFSDYEFKQQTRKRFVQFEATFGDKYNDSCWCVLYTKLILNGGIWSQPPDNKTFINALKTGVELSLVNDYQVSLHFDSKSNLSALPNGKICSSSLFDMNDRQGATLKNSAVTVLLEDPSSDFKIAFEDWREIFESNGIIDVKILLPVPIPQISFLIEQFGNFRVARVDLSNSKLTLDGFLPLVLPHEKMELYDLSFENCGIINTEKENFRRIPNLKILNISKNKLQKMPSGIEYLRKLVHLNMSDQQVGSFSLDRIRLPALESFDISFTPLHFVNRTILASLTNLRFLNMSHCNLTNVPDMKNLVLLNVIDLSYNVIKTINSDHFINLPVHSILNLSHNNLHDPLNFKFTNDIDILDLSFNYIESPPLVFEMGNIALLNLSHNSISTWESQNNNVSNINSVNILDLEYNEIPVINKRMLKFLLNVKVFHIVVNPIDCTHCDIEEFKTIISSGLMSKLNDDIKCILPIDQSGVSVIQSDADLTHCLTGIKKYLNTILASFGSLVIVAILVVILAYSYRHQLIYIRHLWRMKRRTEAGEKNADNYDYDLFVSFCSKDRNWVMEYLLPSLEEPTDPNTPKYRLCLHERDFRLGSYIMDNIVNCIERSRRVLFVLTYNFLTSEWCQWELRMAQHRIFEGNSCDDVILLELLPLDYDVLPLGLRVFMSTRTYLEWPKDASNYQKFWIRLRQYLGTPIQLSSNKTTDIDADLNEFDEFDFVASE